MKEDKQPEVNVEVLPARQSSMKVDSKSQVCKLIEEEKKDKSDELGLLVQPEEKNQLALSNKSYNLSAHSSMRLSDDNFMEYGRWKYFK